MHANLCVFLEQIGKVIARGANGQIRTGTFGGVPGQCFMCGAIHNNG